MSGKAAILVVDDDASIRETFRAHLTEAGHRVTLAESAEQALNGFAELDPALVITDLRMSGMSGIEFLGHLRAAGADVPVLVITAHEDMRSAIDAMKAGAYDYLVKPLDLDQIDLLVERCLRERAVQRRARSLADAAAEPYALDRLIGRDPRMIEIYKRIGTLATTRTPVLIRGETGTGKELIARAIHYNSDRADEPFVAVNCTALPETLLESELFGHVRGAFTGATHDRRGHFERAGSGTIFLDEIGDISPAFQAKLLRVLQEREFYPVGSEKVRRTEARVLAATHRDLQELVRTGAFREDLFFRLRVVEIDVPPLRDRREDIPLLARYLLERMGREMHREDVVLAATVGAVLQAYPWPGNVRELENALSRALITARGAVIGPEHFALEDITTPIHAEGPADLSLAAAERAQIQRVLEYTGGNKREACRLLRISRTRLDRLLARHEIVVAK